MKVLHFHATASVAHPKVLGAFEAQTRNTLRPFNQFIGQAIHTAKQRQFRYQLPWERVRNLITVELEALDSLLRVPRPRPGIVITNWPADAEPALGQPAFAVNRGTQISVLSAVRMDAGLRIRTETPVLPDDRLFWGGRECTFATEQDSTPPRQVGELDGRAVEVLGVSADEGDGHWTLVVEGVWADCDLVVDGETVEAETIRPTEGLRRVVDSAGASFVVSGGMLRVEEPPADGPLRSDSGVRFAWRAQGAGGRRGNWVQLLPPETSSSDDFMDPRTAFCEGDVREVLTSMSRRPADTYKVKKVDQDRYQLLLDRWPEDGSTLFLPVDVRNLYLQKRALRQLSEAPLPHHRGLMRLCEDPQHASWPKVNPVVLDDHQWRSLTDATRSGTDEQRDFVAKALASPDFAFLEGPPGSGKTTAICEIIQQLIDRGQRVLLCASTHVAIDNVLERLIGSGSPIDAVRIGKVDKVDDKVVQTQLDTRIEALIAAWRKQPAMRSFGDGELLEMAQRTIIMAANLTCGTTMGVVNHPLFRDPDEGVHIAEHPITTMPHWDVLIVDEASKTLIQEFLVPALMARRWIIVGDVRQLPPFADRDDIVANLRGLVDHDDREVFPRDHQRACLLLFRLPRPALRQPGFRWLIAEPSSVLDWIERELAVEPFPNLAVVRIVARSRPADGPVRLVTVEQVQDGAAEALLLASADWVLVADDLLFEVANLLPSNLLMTRDLAEGSGALADAAPVLLRQAWWLWRCAGLQQPYKDKKFRRDDIATMVDSQSCERDWLRRHDLAQELAWRLTRLHELRHSRSDSERKWLRADLRRLQPVAADISGPIAEIEDIGLPSILEVLQEGIGEDRTKRPSALTAGFRASRQGDFDARFQSLSYQHRMHPEIAKFARDIIYDGESLKTANTIEIRDAALGWDFGAFRERRAWAHVEGREHNGENPDEVGIIAGLLREFVEWARAKGPPARGGPDVWEVACLCFYVKQEHALSAMLRDRTGVDSNTRFRVPDAPVEIVCGTVDRFQGREADLVALSMRNTGRVGFLDSPNRLNVAVTRARQQLVVVGNANYFGRCGTSELQELSTRTPRVDEQDVRRWKRGRQ